VAELMMTGCSQRQPRGVKSKSIEVILQTTQPQSNVLFEDQPICTALAQLAKDQGLNPQQYTTYRPRQGFDHFTTAFGRLVTAGQTKLVLVVETVEPATIPGRSANQFILLSPEGRILDRLYCEINSRYGRLQPNVLSTPFPDGTQIIVRFCGSVLAGKTNWWHNWHTIGHAGVERTFSDENKAGPNDWDRLGLVRLAVSQKGFVVTHPKPEGSEQGRAANRSQPGGLQTNQTSAAAGSGR
jgi:hypothetical protein